MVSNIPCDSLLHCINYRSHKILIMESSIKEAVQLIEPFSSGSEAMWWMDYNCYQCKKACLWDCSVDNHHFEKAVKEGKECWMKYDMDLGFVIGEIPLKTFESIKGDQEDISRCSKWKPRDDDQGDEGINPPPINPFQLLLFPLDHAKDMVEESILFTSKD